MSVQYIIVVRTMQDAFDSIQPHPRTRTREGFHWCSQVMQEGLDIPPMNIAAWVKPIRQRVLYLTVTWTDADGIPFTTTSNRLAPCS